MPEPSTETWREAHRMIAAYGDDAAVMAAMAADEALDVGNVDDFHAWQRVVKAIESLVAPNDNPSQTAAARIPNRTRQEPNCRRARG